MKLKPEKNQNHATDMFDIFQTLVVALKVHVPNGYQRVAVCVPQRRDNSWMSEECFEDVYFPLENRLST